MTEWAVVLTPLLVLSIVLLFRFVGCGLDVVGQAPPKPPDYRKYILGDPNNPGEVLHPKVKPNGADVTAYWRLVDDASATAAKDEKGFQDGNYRTSTDPDTVPGDFVTGQSSLILSDPGVMGRLFNGGYVLVPAKSNLFTD